MSRTIAIDLGSYNSTVSVYEGNDIKVVPSTEGKNSIPSMVAFTEDGIKVGGPAQRQRVTNPHNTIFNVKRLIGKSYDKVKHLVSERPYKIIDNNGKVGIQAEVGGEVKNYSPEEISAYVISALKKDAEDYLGEKVDKVVITVPAHFDSDERQATKIAGEIAGLEVIKVISEPTAAVLNTDASKDTVVGVYDLGGLNMAS